ncbi:ABC transporter ATP-binding protein [Tabrizicola piscis]|nr:ABC transporter ATP-binding protein [Tabrizicola piscis]
MIEVYRKIFSLLDRRERRQFWLLTALMVIVAFAEVVGISAVLVLLNVIADPSTIQSNAYLGLAYSFAGFSSEFNFMVGLAVVVLLVVLGGLAVKAVGTYASIRFATMRGFTVSSRLLEAYLGQPYAWFLARNSSDIAKNVLVEVDGLVTRVMAPAFRMIASVLMVLAIVGLLMVVDPLITVLAAGLLGLSYALVYIVLRERLRRLGDVLMRAFAERFRVAQEAIGGIKEVKLLGLEESYMELYRRAAQKSARAQATIGVVSELPRFALEAISFGTLLTLILVLLLRSGGSIVEAVPTLGVFALSVMRLLPALQQVYQALASIRGATAILETVVKDHAGVPAAPVNVTQVQQPLHLRDQLDLSGITFSYATAGRPALRGLDMKIAARTTVGIVGGTGAGKTTVVDLVLGLLIPDTGTLSVDQEPLTPANLRAWQKSLGYVPQSIFLTDDTIAANIAFGVPADEIDMQAVERAARTAALHDFVSTELPQAYQTVVGERGIRLSGGQRQRIGIARALYRDPTLLIMDEATSALDNITERVVMEAVQNIRADKTIILIAHRLTTVRNCDTIFLMEHGQVVAQGTYDELVAGSETFRKMAVGV